MAVAHAQSTGTTGTASVSIAFSSGVTAGSLLTAGYGTGDSGDVLTDISDNNSNGGWAQADGIVNSGMYSALWYCPNANSGSTTVTANQSATPFQAALIISEFTGVAASNPLEDTSTGSGFSTTDDAGSVTNTTDDAVVVGITVTSATFESYTSNGGFTESFETGPGSSRPASGQRLILSSATTTGCTWTHTGGNGNYASVCGVFKGLVTTYNQEGFRWRLDDGDEDGATWAEAQDVNIATPVGAARRLRVLVDTRVVDAPSNQYYLQYRNQKAVLWDQVPVITNGTVEVRLSPNISAGGANTTGQLSAPASGSTFFGGRIQDDENPTDAVNPAVDQYLEFEWNLETLPNCRPGEAIEFRVLVAAGLVPFDFYTVTPVWQVQSGGNVNYSSQHPNRRLRS